MALVTAVWSPTGVACQITLQWDNTVSNPQHTVLAVVGSTSPYPAPVINAVLEGSSFMTAWTAAQPVQPPPVLSQPGTVFTYDALSASAGASNFTLVPATLVTGLFRISGCMRRVQAATTSSTLGPLVLSYTGSDGTALTQTCQFQNSAGTAQTSNAINSITQTGMMTMTPLTIFAKAGTAILATFTYVSSGATPMLYELHFRVEAL